MDFIRNLLAKDFARKSRQRFFHARRVLTVGILSCVFAIAYLQSMLSPGALGLRLFQGLLPLVMLFAAFGAPLSAARTMQRERQSRAIDLLMVSDISLAQLVTARYVATVLVTLIGMLCALPLIMLCVSLGGISNVQVVLALLLLFGTICLSSSLGFLAGSLANGNRQAITGAVALSAITYMGIPLLASFYQVAEDLSPFGLLNAIASGKGYGQAARLAISSFCLAALITALAAAILGRRQRRSADAVVTMARQLHPGDRPPIGDQNPVAWHELYCRMGSRRLRTLRKLGRKIPASRLSLIIVGTLLLAAVPLLLIDHQHLHAGSRSLENLLILGNVIGYSLVLLFVGIYLLSSFWQSCHVFESERDSGLLELIASTDLTGRDIVEGKVVAIRRFHQPLLTFIIIACALTLWCNLATYMTSASWMELAALVPAIMLIFTVVTALVGGWHALTGVGLYTGYQHPNHPVLAAIGFGIILYIPLAFVGWAAGIFVIIIGILLGELLETAGIDPELTGLLFMLSIPFVIAAIANLLGFLVGIMGRQLTIFRLHRLQGIQKR